jgi:hypothetical protein
LPVIAIIWIRATAARLNGESLQFDAARFSVSATTTVPLTKVFRPTVVCSFILNLGTSVFGQDQFITTKPDNSSTETIVAIRHAEKPPAGLGNLNCKGLNRSLALPNVLLSKYGKPQYIFAPDPNERFEGSDFNYVRPLLTIEPTAIRCELPVNTEFGYTNIDSLAQELRRPDYQHALIFIAWQHNELRRFAKLLIALYGGDPNQVPFWSERDYDTIFIFKIQHQNDHDTLAFSIDHEALDNLSDTCP